MTNRLFFLTPGESDDTGRRISEDTCEPAGCAEAGMTVERLEGGFGLHTETLNDPSNSCQVSTRRFPSRNG